MPKRRTKKSKLTKLFKTKRFRKYLPVLALTAGVIIGVTIAWLQPPDQHPRSLVWAADDTVQVPTDLYEFLRNRQECAAYKGTGSADGVSLWGVYHVSQSRLAKISHGCSYDMSFYVVAVKDKGSWQLLNRKTYFSNNLPKCEFVDQYRMDKEFEPFCVEANGSARENTITE